MEKMNLIANSRSVLGRKVKKLRSEGQIPANIYGKKTKSIAISVNEKEFLTLFAISGETGLLELKLDSKTHPVLVHMVQYHPVTQSPMHIDFLEVDLKEKVTANVPVEIIGDAPAVKEKIGVLLTLLSEVEVEAFPQDLPDHLNADVSALKEVGQTLTVASLQVPEKVSVLTEKDQEIIKVAPLVSKEAEKMAAEEAAAAQAAAQTQTSEGGQDAASGSPAEPKQSTEAKPQETKK